MEMHAAAKLCARSNANEASLGKNARNCRGNAIPWGNFCRESENLPSKDSETIPAREGSFTFLFWQAGASLRRREA
jgi:hypothetical protein